MKGLEIVYKKHHQGRGDGFAILQKERGDFLKKHIGTGKRVLDIGCRDGQLTSQYLPGNTVVGVDVDSGALARAHERFAITTIQADLNDEWGFTTDAFDVVVACEFLEHIYFPEVVLMKVKQKLTAEGMLVGTIPHAYSVQSRIKFLLGIKTGTPLEDPTHINHFTYKEFRALLQKHFTEVEIETYVPPRYRFLRGLFPYAFAHDLLFVAKTPLHSSEK